MFCFQNVLFQLDDFLIVPVYLPRGPLAIQLSHGRELGLRSVCGLLPHVADGCRPVPTRGIREEGPVETFEADCDNPAAWFRFEPRKWPEAWRFEAGTT